MIKIIPGPEMILNAEKILKDECDKNKMNMTALIICYDLLKKKEDLDAKQDAGISNRISNALSKLCILSFMLWVSFLQSCLLRLHNLLQRTEEKYMRHTQTQRESSELDDSSSESRTMIDIEVEPPDKKEK